MRSEPSQAWRCLPACLEWVSQNAIGHWLGSERDQPRPVRQFGGRRRGLNTTRLSPVGKKCAALRPMRPTVFGRQNARDLNGGEARCQNRKGAIARASPKLGGIEINTVDIQPSQIRAPKHTRLEREKSGAALTNVFLKLMSERANGSLTCLLRGPASSLHVQAVLAFLKNSHTGPFLFFLKLLL
jgi:hypothetical protein